MCQILSISISDKIHQVNLTRIGTTQDPPDWPQPSHLRHWLKETATFLEIYNREASLTKLLRGEKASLMAERDQLVETLQKREERHKLALRLLCQEKDNVTKELQERLRKMGEQMESKIREMTNEKETLIEKLEEDMAKKRGVMQAEMKNIKEHLLQSNSENAKVHAKLKTMAETVKTYKTFHDQLNSAFQNVT